jgi:DNA-binding LytR/AlgR family response regulator
LQASRLLQQLQPHVLFLDIEMPGRSGLEVARAASGRCHVVFVTAYDQYAVAAFEEGAVDYMLKPFDAVRMTTACNRVKERLNAAPASLDSLLERLAESVARKRPYLRWINVEAGAKVAIVNVSAISEVARDMRGHLLLHLKARKETLQVSQPYAHLFRQM